MTTPTPNTTPKPTRNSLTPRKVADCHELNGDTIAIDFETYYDKDYSLKKTCYHHYCNDPRFDAYIMSAATDEEVWVGHPRDFDWEVTRDKTVISHNAAFDRTVYEIGLKAPGDWPMRSWLCSMAACNYLNIRGNLAQISWKLLNISMSKEVREAAQGVDFSKMEEIPEDMINYVAFDSISCLAVWYAIEKYWPSDERYLWSQTVDMGVRGIPTNKKWLQAALKRLEKRVAYHESQIPLQKTQSRNELIAYCKANGIEPPTTTAKTNPLWEKWLDEWGQSVPWIRHLALQRSANRVRSIFSTALERLYTDENGVDRVPFTLRYMGAGTGRWCAGSDGFNAQQFNRERVEGINTRHMIQAGKGFRLVVADFAAVEVRVVMWLSGQTEIFDYLKQTPDLYEAFARFLGQMPAGAKTLKGWCEENHSPLRHQIKSQVLGAGFCLGYKGLHKNNPNIPLERCKELIDGFRAKCPKVVAMWHNLERIMKRGIASPNRCFALTLPSGRKVWYRDIHRELITPKDKDKKPFTAWVASTPDDNGKPGNVILSVALLTNNIVQATARDLMKNAIVKAGIQGKNFELVLPVHDELVVRCRKEDAPAVEKAISKFMTEQPSWASTLELSAPPSTFYNYTKD